MAHRVICCSCTKVVVIGAKRTWLESMSARRGLNLNREPCGTLPHVARCLGNFLRSTTMPKIAVPFPFRCAPRGRHASGKRDSFVPRFFVAAVCLYGAAGTLLTAQQQHPGQLEIQSRNQRSNAAALRFLSAAAATRLKNNPLGCGLLATKPWWPFSRQ